MPADDNFKLGSGIKLGRLFTNVAASRLSFASVLCSLQRLHAESKLAA